MLFVVSVVNLRLDIKVTVSISKKKRSNPNSRTLMWFNLSQIFILVVWFCLNDQLTINMHKGGRYLEKNSKFVPFYDGGGWGGHIAPAGSKKLLLFYFLWDEMC